MKKHCDGCKASDFGLTGLYEYQCDLGYKVDKSKAIPMEQCPKPRTIIKWMELKDLKEKNNLISLHERRSCNANNNLTGERRTYFENTYC